METFVNTYKSLYKELTASEDKVEDFQLLMDIATNACIAIENILTEKNLPRSKKCSLESSLGHFITIQLELADRVKKGGDVAQKEIDELNKAAFGDLISDLPEDVSDSENNSMIVRDLETNAVKWSEINSAFKNRIKTGVISNIKHLDFETFMNDSKVLFEEQIKKVLIDVNSIKVNTMITAKYIIKKADVEDKVDDKHFNTKNIPIFQTTNLSDVFEENIRRPLDNKMSEFQEHGSGWSLQCILQLVININKFNPMRVGSYIELPKVIKDKKACINVKNDDELCFKWAVLAGLYKGFKNPQNKFHYKPFENSLNFDGIKFPVSLKDVAKFERQNDVSVNVYILKRYDERYEVSPVYLTSFKQEDHVNLLLIQDYYIDEYNEGNDDVDCEPPKYHYVLIKNLSRLVRSQLSSDRRKCFICDRCLHFFWTEEKLNNHEIDCSQKNVCKIVLSREKYLKFKNYNRKERVPIVIYADTECLITPREDDQPGRVVNNHQAFSIGFYAKYSFDDSLSEYKSYRQMDESMQSPAEWFVAELKEIGVRFEEFLKNIKPMALTKEDCYMHEISDCCHICGELFRKKDPKVRDHCHLTGR